MRYVQGYKTFLFYIAFMKKDITKLKSDIIIFFESKYFPVSFDQIVSYEIKQQ
jgi:hypothetical protein